MGMYYEGGGYVLTTQPQAMQQARSVWGEGGGGVGEQQIRALGKPLFFFLLVFFFAVYPAGVR